MIAEFAALCLATTIYFEARGESTEGQFAVAHVVMTRAKKKKTSPCYQALRHKQFSWVNGQTRTKNRVILAAFQEPQDRKAWRKASRIAILVIKGAWDNTGGATHYHKVGIKPAWSKKMKRIGTIGHHHLYKEKEMINSKERHTRKAGPGRFHAEPGLKYARKDKVVFNKDGRILRSMIKMERQAQAAMLTTNRTS